MTVAHLNTLVGGKITTLRPMLEHYIGLGVDSVQVNVHLTSKNDPMIEQVRAITDSLGLSIGSVVVGSWQAIIAETYEQSRMRYPGDWHIVADQDEFQVYPSDLRTIKEGCTSQGFDYVS